MIYTVTLNPALDYFMNYEELALGEVNRTGKHRFQQVVKELWKVAC